MQGHQWPSVLIAVKSSNSWLRALAGERLVAKILAGAFSQNR